MPRLEEQSIIVYSEKEFGIRLRGKVYNHFDIEDYKGLILTSIGTIYELGEIDLEYEKLYPNTRKN